MSLREAVGGFLQEHGIRLNTNLGQHFLVEEEVLDLIVATADLNEKDHVVEIGPGLGVLTKELLASVKEVTAIELDVRMIPLLKGFTKAYQMDRKYGNLTIIPGNALHVSLPETPYKIVANIPYHITSPLLRHAFLESKKPPTSMTLLIQREVAEKIVDTKQAGMLTILVGLFGAPSLMSIVPPYCFLPPPEVDSAVLHIESFPEPLADRETIEMIFKLTKIGFSQKRKMLRNTLGRDEKGAEILGKVGIELTRRPETMTVQEWIEVAKLWRSAVEKN